MARNEPKPRPNEMRRYGIAVQRLLQAMILHGWKCQKGDTPKPGDLVMLTSAPPSDWHLSFYRQDQQNGYHLLESLRTGELCPWGNVGFLVIDREKVGLLERAEWSDAQFEFQDKFHKVYSRADFYINIPFIDRFEGDLVHVAFRTRFGLDEIRTAVEPIRWPKVNHKALRAALAAGEAAHIAARDAQKQERSDA